MGEMLAHIILIGCGALFLLVPVIFLSSLFSMVYSYNPKKLKKENNVLIGRNFLEVNSRVAIGGSLSHRNRFPRKDIVMVTPAKDSDIDPILHRNWNTFFFGMKNLTNISLHHPFVSRDNLLLVKFDRELRINHSHVKKKWYQNTIGEVWTDSVIIDIPREKHDEFLDLVFS